MFFWQKPARASKGRGVPARRSFLVEDRVQKPPIREEGPLTLRVSFFRKEPKKKVKESFPAPSSILKGSIRRSDARLAKRSKRLVCHNTHLRDRLLAPRHPSTPTRAPTWTRILNDSTRLFSTDAEPRVRTSTRLGNPKNVTVALTARDPERKRLSFIRQSPKSLLLCFQNTRAPWRARDFAITQQKHGHSRTP